MYQEKKSVKMDITLPGDNSHHGHDVPQDTDAFDPCMMGPGEVCSILFLDVCNMGTLTADA